MRLPCLLFPLPQSPEFCPPSFTAPASRACLLPHPPLPQLPHAAYTPPMGGFPVGTSGCSSRVSSPSLPAPAPQHLPCVLPSAGLHAAGLGWTLCLRSLRARPGKGVPAGRPPSLGNCSLSRASITKAAPHARHHPVEGAELCSLSVKEKYRLMPEGMVTPCELAAWHWPLPCTSPLLPVGQRSSQRLGSSG